MKARSLTFYIQPDRLAEVVKVLDEQIVPEYRDLPSFVGLVVLHTDHIRKEVVGLSIWDGDLDASEEATARFRNSVTNVLGASVATETFDVLRLVASGS
ncbi:MAG: hypothetical protein ACLQRM_17645 [Acidimicrobiales bacterium]|jgi:hypothetical protein